MDIAREFRFGVALYMGWIPTAAATGSIIGAALADEGFDKTYGARPLRRAIQSKIEDRLSELILDGTVKPNTKCTVDFKDGEFTFSDKAAEKVE